MKGDTRDQRDPLLLGIALASSRRPGEKLSQAADRLAAADVPDFGSLEAREAYARLNGHVEEANRKFHPAVTA